MKRSASFSCHSPHTFDPMEKRCRMDKEYLTRMDEIDERQHELRNSNPSAIEREIIYHDLRRKHSAARNEYTARHKVQVLCVNLMDNYRFKDTPLIENRTELNKALDEFMDAEEKLLADPSDMEEYIEVCSILQDKAHAEWKKTDDGKVYKSKAYRNFMDFMSMREFSDVEAYMKYIPDANHQEFRKLFKTGVVFNVVEWMQYGKRLLGDAFTQPCYE